MEHLQSAALGHLLEAASRRSFDDGALIHAPSRPSSAWFWIKSGRVRFNTLTRDGNLVELFTLGLEEGFGEISLFSGQPPPHHATAIGLTELLRIEGRTVKDLVGRHPEVRDWLMHRLALRLSNAYRLVDELRYQSPPARIWRYLYWLAANGHGARGEAGPVVKITQGELASRLGLSRATVASVLSGLSAKGRLKTGYGRIELIGLDPQEM